MQREWELKDRKSTPNLEFCVFSVIGFQALQNILCSNSGIKNERYCINNYSSITESMYLKEWPRNLALFIFITWNMYKRTSQCWYPLLQHGPSYWYHETSRTSFHNTHWILPDVHDIHCWTYTPEDPTHNVKEYCLLRAWLRAWTVGVPRFPLECVRLHFQVLSW